MSPMLVLMFVGRWAWIAVIAISILIGAYLFRTLHDFDDSARLVSDVGELRGYQEALLQAQVAGVLLGAGGAASADDILAEARASADALIARIDPDRHHCADCAPAEHDPTHDHGTAEAIEAVIRNLEALATIGGPETANYVQGLEANPTFSLGTGIPGAETGTGSSAGSSAGAGGMPPGLGGFEMAIRYTTISANVTANLDEATNRLAEDGRAAAGRVQRVGRIGIGTLLVGGLMSTTGFAWSGRRARKLRWEVERAGEMDALKSEFVGLASHELRTPLAGIYGFSELLLSDDALPERSRGWAERINDESRRLSDIVESLLNISRIEAGQIEVTLEPAEVGPVVRAVGEMFSGVSATHAITLDGELEATVIADPKLLTQVLSNLVDNAVKYSPEGGAVRVHGAVNGGRLAITVSDEGLGIPADDLPLIFERFHRAARPGTESIRSTGLGLYLVRELLERMGGTVTAESTVDVGTTMTVTLPLQDGAATDSAD